MRNLLILFLLVSALSCSDESASVISSTEKELLKVEIEEISQDFYDLFETEVGQKMPYYPEINIQISEGLIYFSGDVQSGEVVVPIWEELDADTKALLETWVEGTDFTAEQFFRENFNWFLIPHELGHFMQTITGTESNYWDDEIEANQIAIAYWKYKGETERLNKFIAVTQQVLTKMDAPEDLSKEYFNSNYDDITDPQTYGYFQFTFYQMAMESDFDIMSYIDYIKQLEDQAAE